ncbi:hypothetical protein BC827DRAFT_541382 [Russula dissimulans]|nr:hypothetical protein BC827DRAFT_541382 [Russula dissimulans]
MPCMTNLKTTNVMDLSCVVSNSLFLGLFAASVGSILFFLSCSEHFHTVMFRASQCGRNSTVYCFVVCLAVVQFTGHFLFGYRLSEDGYHGEGDLFSLMRSSSRRGA